MKMTTRYVLLLVLTAANLECQARREPISANVTTLLAECRADVHHGQTAAAKTCFEKLVATGNTYARAEGLWGLHDYKGAFNEFSNLVDHAPDVAEYHARLGRLLYERYTMEDAGEQFEAAHKLDANNTDALIGLALLHALRYDKEAVEYAKKAADVNPKLTEPREVLARLAAEDNDYTAAEQEADKALSISPEALDALAVHAAIKLLHDQSGDDYVNRMVKVNPHYGEGFALIGHLLVINRRYDDGITYYRKAVAAEPGLWSAHSELGVSLMRLGQEKEAYTELKSAWENGWRDAETTNTLKLIDSYKNFVTITKPRVILKLNKKEAGLLEPYFEAEAEKALATYDKKYGFKLQHPVQIEVYPDHEDFAVRTMGMPGLGALGVTFDTVIAMDSPSGRKPGSFHWGSTLWHELSHVYVLTATNHRVPRWFTEGMAVHEETAVSPEWGDRLDPTVLNAIESKKLLPIAELDRGFVRPTYPNQVIVSYFQAGQICDFINETRGYSKLLAMMHDFGKNTPTDAVVQEELGVKPADFDKEFNAWLDKRFGAQVKNFKEWREKNRKLQELAKNKQYDEAIKDGNAIRDLYPDYVEGGNVYEAMATIYLAKGEKDKAVGELERYAKKGGRDPDLLKKLAKLEEETGHKAEAAAALERINYIYLHDDQLHRELGRLSLDLHHNDEAIREYGALVAMNPVDPAAAQYDLARAYAAAKQNDQAREHVLQALEAAPGYKPAQKLLLELSPN